MNKLNHELFNVIQEINYPVTLPVSGINLTVTPYKHGDLKPVLRLFEEYKRRKKGHLLKALTATEVLVQSCIKPNVTGERINVRNLQIADFTYLSNYLKGISNGEKSKVSFHCKDDNCEGLQEFYFILEDCEIINKDNKTEKVEIENGSNNIQIFLKPYTFGTLIENCELFSGELETGDEVTKFYSSFVEAIGVTKLDENNQPQEKIYDNLAKQITMKFLDKLTEAQLMPLVNYIDKCPKMFWYKEFDCPTCGVKNKAKIEEILDFFV